MDNMYLEGNNGGDYLKIGNSKDNRVYIEIGSCCVHIFRGIVPVEFLTSVLTNAILDKGGVTGYLMSTAWDNDFRVKLCNDVAQEYPPPPPPHDPANGEKP